MIATVILLYALCRLLNCDFICLIASLIEEKEKVQTFPLVKGRKAQVGLINLIMALFYFPITHGSVSWDSESWNTKTEAFKSQSIIKFISYTCTFTLYLYYTFTYHSDHLIFNLKMSAALIKPNYWLVLGLCMENSSDTATYHLFIWQISHGKCVWGGTPDWPS